MIEFVKEFDFLLQFASEELKNDRDLVLKAMTIDKQSFRYASHDLQKNDREIALEAVKQDGYALKYVSTELKDMFQKKLLKTENLC